MEPQGGVTPQTINAILAYRAAGSPAAPYLRMDDAVLSFGEVDDQAEALAASLANLGVGPGDRIALVLPAWPEFAITVFAAARIGALVVPVDPRLRLPELRYALRHSGAVCAVSAENAYGIDFLQIFEDLLVELPALSHLVTVGKEDLWYDDRIFQWEDLLSAGVGRDFAAPAAAPEDPFAILYTSGTSGKPRGVELTHGNLLHRRHRDHPRDRSCPRRCGIGSERAAPRLRPGPGAPGDRAQRRCSRPPRRRRPESRETSRRDRPVRGADGLRHPAATDGRAR